jgi:hypothetical protein
MALIAQTIFALRTTLPETTQDRSKPRLPVNHVSCIVEDGKYVNP